MAPVAMRALSCPLETNFGQAQLSSVRGKVLEKGMPDSFRRFTEPGIDDVRSRTEGLAQFIRAASERYRFNMRQLIVVGYSNGANLAASLILLHPHYLAGAILFRAMVPLVPEIIRDFSNLSVFIGAAHQYPLIPPGTNRRTRSYLPVRRRRRHNFLATWQPRAWRG